MILTLSTYTRYELLLALGGFKTHRVLLSHDRLLFLTTTIGSFLFWMDIFLSFVELILLSISFVSIKQNLSIISFHIISVSLRLDILYWTHQ